MAAYLLVKDLVKFQPIDEFRHHAAYIYAITLVKFLKVSVSVVSFEVNNGRQDSAYRNKVRNAKWLGKYCDWPKNSRGNKMD